MTSTGGGRRRAISARPALPALVAGMVLAAALSGCAVQDQGAERPAPSATAAPSPKPTPSPAPSVEGTPVPQSDASLGSVKPIGLTPPVRLVIPALSIDMDVQAEGVDAEGAMDLPVDAATAGWYRFGPGLGDAQGATVVAAHVDSWHDGVGPFSRLQDLAIGSTVSAIAADGSAVEYTVSEVRAVGKIDAPMAEVFDRTGDPRLTLVTCGGVFDSSTGHYLDNIIVTAVPSAASATSTG